MSMRKATGALRLAFLRSAYDDISVLFRRATWVRSRRCTWAIELR